MGDVPLNVNVALSKPLGPLDAAAVLSRIVMNAVVRVPTVRESQGILSESGKVRENRDGQGKVREF